jgi:hypothetical protein
VPGPPQDWTDDESSSSGSGGNSAPAEVEKDKADENSDLPDPATKLH